MPRQLLDQQLQGLFSQVLTMGAMVENALEMAVKALSSRDTLLAREVVEGDATVNKARWGLEEECYRLLATQQPMATDLRTVGAVLSIVSDVERIGDHADGIARIVQRMSHQPLLEPGDLIQQMSRKCRKDLRLVLEAFVNHDESMARAVCAEDDQVDQLYRQAFEELLHQMVVDPRRVDQATYLIWVAHKLERIHDRITNIGRRTIFMVTGRMEELSASGCS